MVKERTLDYAGPAPQGRVAEGFFSLPEWPFAAVAVALLAVACYGASMPDGSVILTSLAVVGWLVLGVAWLLRLSDRPGKGTRLVPVGPSMREKAIAMWGRAVVQLACIATITLVVNDVPLAVAFRLSRPALESQAKALASKGTSTSTTSVHAPWYGECDAMVYDYNTVQIRPGFADGAFVYSPAGRPTGMGQYRPLSGAWYIWHNTN